jgi:hypothetical protein
VEANPYLLTAIGVAGTLFGAVVAAVTQAVTSRAMRASQAQMLDIQTRHATEQLLREQRREVYAQFIRALDEASALGGRRQHPEAHADGVPTKEEMDQANRKLLKLQRDLDLLATEKVERTARAVQQYIVTQMYGHDIAGQPPPLTLFVEAETGSLAPGSPVTPVWLFAPCSSHGLGGVAAGVAGA